MTNLEYKIRKYRTLDRFEIRRICSNTGFLGNPMDKILFDPNIFVDIVAEPYIQLEPEHAFVAEYDDRVIGYLLGSTDSDFELKAAKKIIKPVIKATGNKFIGGYDRYPRTKLFVNWMLVRSLFERPKHPKDAAHLHINLEKKYRGNGIKKC